jgi:hypothetical protein
MSPKSGIRSNSWFLVSIGVMAGLIIGFAAALYVQSHVHKGGGHDEVVYNDTLSAPEVDRPARRNASASNNIIGTEGERAGDVLSSDSVLARIDSLQTHVDHGDDTLHMAITDGTAMVRRDVMVGIKRIRPDLEPPDEATATGSGSASDTLLNALTAIKIPEGIHREYVVEFWQNPLNYRGYRLTRDKIVLFGMDIDRSYRLEVKDGVLVLQTGNQEFLLREGSGFSPLNPSRRN